METTFSIVVQIIAYFALGVAIANGLLWFGKTKVGKTMIALFILPYLIWIIHKLSKDEFLARLQERIERGKITYYF